MKKVLAFAIVFLVISACEKDDFCTQNPVTPKLILRFYDNINRSELKSVDQLYVWAEGKDSIFINTTTDSLSIPLNSIANQTVYNFSKGSVVNQFTIQYTPREEYISRSCGFRVVFENANFSTNNTWIQDFASLNATINNQNQAHVQIFH